MPILGIDPGDPFGVALVEGDGVLAHLTCARDGPGVARLHQAVEIADAIFIEDPGFGHRNVKAAMMLRENRGFILGVIWFANASVPVYSLPTATWRKHSHGVVRSKNPKLTEIDMRFACSRALSEPDSLHSAAACCIGLAGVRMLSDAKLSAKLGGRVQG